MLNIIANVLATMKTEGFEPSKEAIDIGRLYLEGKITCDEAIAKIKELHKK